MADMVIATAGHVDHGKTTLIKALTGIETDTTAEEKKRGLTINLGFAYLDLPNGQRVGIVDVPGHEKFIKNMVAGLPGINLVLLVIDAAEGVMPQTREHMDILTLLGIRNFLVVLTKIDTVSKEMKEMALADIREKLAHTALADAEIMETDALSGKGIPELKKKIAEWAEKLPSVTETGAARLNIDRVFSVKGFGTVVTGTLLDGAVSVGDQLILYPGMKKTRIRNIQIHEQNVQKATARHRTALNLADIRVDEIKRGDVLAVSQHLQPTWMVDGKVQCLAGADKPIRLWSRVRVLTGTREVMARAVPIGTDAILPGGDGFLQLRLEEQLVVKEHDHFILRSYSPLHTIGGGEILDAAPKKHKRFKPAIMESLQTKEEGSLQERIEDFLINKADALTSLQEIQTYTGVSSHTVHDEMEQLISLGRVWQTSAGYLHQAVYSRLKGKVLQTVLDYHRKHPLRQGISPEELKSRLGSAGMENDVAAIVISIMLDNGSCRYNGKKIAARDFSVTFTEKQQKIKDKIEEYIQAAAYTPVKREQLASMDAQAADIADSLVGDTLLFLDEENLISRLYYDKAVEKVRLHFLDHEALTVGDFRDFMGIGRNAAVLLLEYMDRKHITKRVENHRILESGEKEN